ncbi:MAG: hypothetical protein Q9M37_07590 [Desulfonauticus sp.]|nr:hypothetical protein [Desulfonauticus sp.]
MNEEKEKKLKEQFPAEIFALFAGIVPNTKYFDSKFDYLQVQIDELRRNQELMREQIQDFKRDVDYRFEQVDKRFEQVNKRFEQVDKRFEQVDKRFEQIDKRFEQVDKRFEQMDKRIDSLREDMNFRFGQVIDSINRLSDRLDRRDAEHRNFTLKMFSISIMVSILGVLGAFFKIMGIF